MNDGLNDGMNEGCADYLRKLHSCIRDERMLNRLGGSLCR